MVQGAQQAIDQFAYLGRAREESFCLRLMQKVLSRSNEQQGFYLTERATCDAKVVDKFSPTIAAVTFGNVCSN